MGEYEGAAAAAAAVGRAMWPHARCLAAGSSNHDPLIELHLFSFAAYNCWQVCAYDWPFPHITKVLLALRDFPL